MLMSNSLNQNPSQMSANLATGMPPTPIRRRIIRAGGWGLARRLIKPIPVVGTFVVIGLSAFEIRRKGLLRGAIHVGLDLTPVVGTAKNVIEIFTGDWIPDKPDSNKLPPAIPEDLNHR